MKWINGETIESQNRRLAKWHKWFAWYPVKIGVVAINGRIRNVKYWLCYVERRIDRVCFDIMVVLYRVIK